MSVVIDKEIKAVMKSLKANCFVDVGFVNDASTATKRILNMIPQHANVGVPGSVTVRQIGLLTELNARGTKVIDSSSSSESTFKQVLRQTLSTDILLASSNALTLDGKLVNIDGYGNRIAGMIFGPERVVLVIGVNKIVRDVNEAMERIRNVIAPFHAMTKGAKVPCAPKGYCTDCNSPERICNITSIIMKKPPFTDFTIVIVGEDLGLGWDPTWPVERREKIASAYREARKGFSTDVKFLSK